MKRIGVFVVDDSAVVRQVLTSQLAEDPGIEVLGSAPDPVAAGERMKARWPDVVVLGLVLVLAEAIGALWATIAAFLGLLAFAALSGWFALRRWQRASAQLTDAEGQP